MNHEQIYNNCENYNTPKCLHINDKLMEIFVTDVHIVDENGNKPSSRANVINHLFCNTCSSFKDRRI